MSVKPIRVRVGRKTVPLSEATLSQLQVAALKAFPSSPYQLAIRAEINRRHARGEKTWLPPKGNPPREFVPDEGPAEHIRNALQILTLAEEVQGYHQDAVFERDDLIAIKQRLEKALAQVEDLRVYMGLPRKANRRSVRRASNPALAVLGNPRVEDATIATWAKIEYMRPDDPDGSDVVRVHEFKDGFEIGWLSDGSVQLRHPKHPLWMDDEEDGR